jgi:electron transport complex protein RnfG
MREIVKLILVLTLICGVSASALQIARTQLEERIEQQNDRYIRGPALSRLFKMSPEKILHQKIYFHWEDQEFPVFYILEDGALSGLAIEAAGKGGYGGDIRIMIGIDLKSMTLLGMEIIQHSETPGVGSQIEKESFRAQWKNLSGLEELELRQSGGSIQGITGATYSSRAVVNGSNEIIRMILDQRDEIVKMIESRKQGT